MNEKKIRRDIWEWKVTAAFLLVCSLIAGAGALYCQLYLPGDKKVPDHVQLLGLITGYFAYACCMGCGILALGCHILRRQAEYALHLKELITAKKGQPTIDASSDASSLRKAA